MYKLFFVPFLLINLLSLNGIQSEELTLEETIKKSMKNYPFECNPAGNMPEIRACAAIQTIKSDYLLRKEINNDDLFGRWTSVRHEMCNHFMDKQFRGGSIRPTMVLGCEIRLNSEVQKFCLTGDPTCG